MRWARLNAAACHDVMFSTSFDRKKFGWFGGAGVSSFMSDRVEPTLICRCLQALAEALKINGSVTNIDLDNNQIGDEGAKAWCVVGSAESLNAAACHDVMFSTSSCSEKFGWFAGAVVSLFISDRVELSNTRNPAVCHTLSYCM